MPQEVTIRENGTKRVRTVWDPEQDPSRTVQSDRHQAEIKHILKKYEALGIIDHLAEVDLMYRDVTEVQDFHEAARQLKAAEHQFMQLPSKVRELFDHSVENYLDTANDREKLEALRPQMEKLGMIEPRPAPTPAPTEPSIPPTPEPDA